jgi:hypothetical protein
MSNPAGGDGTHVHALDVVGPGHTVGDVPATVADPLVRRQVVADQPEDHHHHVLGDADAVAEGHLGDRDAVCDRRVQVDVVGTDAGGERQLEVRRLGDPLRGQVRGPERLRDDDLGIGQVLVELRVGGVLVRGDHELVAEALEEGAEPELAGDTAQQRSGCEVDGRRRRQGLPVGIALQFRQAVPRVFLGVTINRVVVEYAQHLGHSRLLALGVFRILLPLGPSVHGTRRRADRLFDGPIRAMDQ